MKFRDTTLVAQTSVVRPGAAGPVVENVVLTPHGLTAFVYGAAATAAAATAATLAKYPDAAFVDIRDLAAEQARRFSLKALI